MSNAISGLPLGGAPFADLLAARRAREPGAGGSGEAPDGPGEAQAIQAAKDFESVLIHKLLSEMRNSVPDSGLLQDGTGEQIESMFWMFLSRHVADNGGLGLWKEIYRQAAEADASAAAPATVEQLL